MTTILTETGEFVVGSTDGLWVEAADVARATGWTLKPEGMCRDDACVPLKPGMQRDGRVDLAAFWQLLGAPVVTDEGCEVWVLGTAADERNARLAGLAAPDFTLPDLADKPQSLSKLRGKKVFLSTWASW
jgi:hypothetical protein